MLKTYSKCERMFVRVALLLCSSKLACALLIPPSQTEPARLSDRAVDQVKAIVPVSSGQIGINPVEYDLGDPSTYIGIIYGVDTQYLTLETATITTVRLFYPFLLAY